VKISICVFFENLATKLKFNKILTRINVTLHKDQYKCLITCRSVFLRNRNVSDKTRRENQNNPFTFKTFFRINVTLRRVRVTIIAVECAVSVTYFECVFVALGIQHSLHMLHNFIRGVQLYPIFSHYLIHSTIFEKKLNMQTLFRFSIQHLSEMFLILSRIKLDAIKNVYLSSCKVPVIVVRF